MHFGPSLLFFLSRTQLAPRLFPGEGYTRVARSFSSTIKDPSSTFLGEQQRSHYVVLSSTYIRPGSITLFFPVASTQQPDRHVCDLFSDQGSSSRSFRSDQGIELAHSISRDQGPPRARSYYLPTLSDPGRSFPSIHVRTPA